MQILTFQDASTWDVSPDTGFITFASPEDAKKAEALFNQIQAEAKAVVKDAERYRWLRRERFPEAQEPFICRLSSNVFTRWTGEKADAAIDAAMICGAADQIIQPKE